MNRLICFDLDGVLVDSKDLHYQALNDALSFFSKEFVIDEEEHLALYDGLPTRQKLQLLTSSKSLPVELHQQIWELKQDITSDYFLALPEDDELVDLLQYLRMEDVQIAVASNCIRRTVQNALHALGLLPLLDYFISADEVFRKKPSPDLYWHCMMQCDSVPQNTVIFEDSAVGQQAALNSGAHVICVENRKDLTQKKMEKAVTMLKEQTIFRPKPVMENLNILIPMAGRGSRFEAAGYTFPKPLIDVMGRPMIQWVVENVGIKGNYIFITQEAHRQQYSLDTLLELITGTQPCEVVAVDGLTEGAACTALKARHLIDNDNPLLILNSDQYLEWDLIQDLYQLSNSNVDGAIFTFHSTHPKWSYARLEPGTNTVVEVAEKKPISTTATCGVYWWKKGSDFVKYVDQMIGENDRTLNEFYICPAYNHAIKDGKIIKSIPVRAMHSLGTPEDLQVFFKEFGNV